MVTRLVEIVKSLDKEKDYWIVACFLSNEEANWGKSEDVSAPILNEKEARQGDKTYLSWRQKNNVRRMMNFALLQFPLAAPSKFSQILFLYDSHQATFFDDVLHFSAHY